jgi:hypothetical protein
MRLTHETGIATLLQFIVLGLMNVAGTINSTVHSCRTEENDCLTNIFVSSILFLLLMGWFGLVCLVGYMAQERRSKRLAQLLIAAQGLIALVSVFSIRFPTDLLGQITSVVALISAIWIITLAYRLMRSGGQRITRTKTGRQRRSPRQRVD